VEKEENKGRRRGRANKTTKEPGGQDLNSKGPYIPPMR
jgi:hypothetical protein